MHGPLNVKFMHLYLHFTQIMQTVDNIIIVCLDLLGYRMERAKRKLKAMCVLSQKELRFGLDTCIHVRCKSFTADPAGHAV